MLQDFHYVTLQIEERVVETFPSFSYIFQAFGEAKNYVRFFHVDLPEVDLFLERRETI